MPKRLSSDQIVAVLLKNRFVFYTQKGSHKKYRCQTNQGVKIVVVPQGWKVMPIGTLFSIIRQSGLPKSDFGL